MRPHQAFVLAIMLSGVSGVRAQTNMQPIGAFSIDLTEVTVEQFRQFVNATRTVTAAERAGGGSTFENGWEQRKGWTWQAPFGTPAAPLEPAVHVTYDEAAAFCKWSGKRLPSDAEWGEAAYTERRASPPAGFVTGKTYTYPTGDQPLGANCLGDCGTVKTVGTAVSSRGRGHALAGTGRPGVNGLFDMGGNAWEWVDSGGAADKRTRGGSWWYGAASMRDDHRQSKPRDTAVVYIGFRCARDS
jgi:formylglycine-generating enzyme required for sulfatase activity